MKWCIRLTTTDKVFAVLALASGGLCLYLNGREATLAALSGLVSLAMLITPMLIAGLMLGSLIQQLVSKERVARSLGESSGMKGLLIASTAGIVVPGGPFTSFPLVHALWIAGADIGVLVAFVTAWGLISINRFIVWELPLMGLDFALLRFLVCLPMPILSGLLARWLVRNTSMSMSKVEQ